MSERVHRKLKELMRHQLVATVITGKVISVEGYLCDVRPADGGAILRDVRLKVSVTEDDKGLFCIPVVGSECLVLAIGNDLNQCVLIQAERIDTYLLKLDGGAQLEASPGGTIRINGDQYGGLVKIQELRQDLGKVNDLLNGLKQAINQWVTSPGDGGAAFRATLSAQVLPRPLPTYQSIESDKTKHGSL